VFEPRLPASVEDIHLDDIEFWNEPADVREGAFALLRRDQPISFHKEFDDSCLRSDLGESLPPRPHPTAYLGALLDFCRLTRWGAGTSWEDMKCAS
jgi:hypothetical protein